MGLRQIFNAVEANFLANHYLSLHSCTFKVALRRYTTLHRPLLGGAGRGIDWQGCSKNFFRKSNYCTTFFKRTNVLCKIVKSNAVCNIYMIKSLLAAQMYDNVWSNECRKFLIFIYRVEWQLNCQEPTYLYELTILS